jgi:hypothetical protein
MVAADDTIALFEFKRIGFRTVSGAKHVRLRRAGRWVQTVYGATELTQIGAALADPGRNGPRRLQAP